MADRVNSLLADLRHCAGGTSCHLCGHYDDETFACMNNIAADAADMLQEYIDRCERYADEIMALRERVKLGMWGDKYYEIWALWAYCKRHDIPAEMEPLFDGWKLAFPSGGDFVQHEFSYMSIRGDLEPAIGCEDDYSPVCLDDARALVLKHRQRLTVPRVELPDAPEVTHDDMCSRSYRAAAAGGPRD